MQHPSEFFQALYSQVKHGLAEIRLIHHSGDFSQAKKIYRPATTIHTGDFDTLAELNAEYHIYFRVNVSNEPRSKKPDISQVVALWLEIDNNSPEVEKRLIEYPFPPTMLIHSGGNGYHAYWMLKEPLLVDSDKTRFEVERTLSGMILDWGADSGGDKHTKDITRILRVPFFRNIKEKYAPDYPLCLPVWYDDSQGDRYKFEWLHKRYSPLGAPESPIIRRALPVVDNGDKPKWIMDYLQNGANQGQRNHRLYAVARWYNDNGISESMAEMDLITRALADGLSQTEAQTAIRSAYSAPRDSSNVIGSTMKKRYAVGDKKLQGK